MAWIWTFGNAEQGHVLEVDKSGLCMGTGEHSSISKVLPCARRGEGLAIIQCFQQTREVEISR